MKIISFTGFITKIKAPFKQCKIRNRGLNNTKLNVFNIYFFYSTLTSLFQAYGAYIYYCFITIKEENFWK